MGTATGTTAAGNGTAGALIVVLYLGYTAFKRNGFRPRRVETTLSGQQLWQVFRRTVASTLGDTTKAYSLRWRMNSFIAQVRRLDSTAKVMD